MNREAEAHRCGVLVGAGLNQITKVASAQSRERRKCRRIWNKTIQQSNDCMLEMFKENDNSGDVLGLRFTSQLAAASSR